MFSCYQISIGNLFPIFGQRSRFCHANVFGPNIFMKYVTRHQIAKHTIKTLFPYTSSLSMIAEKQQVLHHPVDFQSTHQTLHLNLLFQSWMQFIDLIQELHHELLLYPCYRIVCLLLKTSNKNTDNPRETTT